MSELVDTFAEIDASLRIVGTLDALDYDVTFVREDLDAAYDEEDFERAYRELMANRVSADDFTRAGDLGPLDCQLFLFREIVAFLFPSSRYGGVLVSFDREDPFPVFDVVEVAADHPDLGDDDLTASR